MPLVTVDKRSAESLAAKGWTKVDRSNDFVLFPPGTEVGKSYSTPASVSKTQKSSKRAGLSQADRIRELLKQEVSQSEMVSLLLREYPKSSRGTVCAHIKGILSRGKKV